jgi:hypothetical protein
MTPLFPLLTLLHICTNPNILGGGVILISTVSYGMWRGLGWILMMRPFKENKANRFRIPQNNKVYDKLITY